MLGYEIDFFAVDVLRRGAAGDSAMIAVVLLISEEPGEPSYTKVFSAGVATMSGVNATCKFRERWLQYLGLRDRLFAERNVFTAGQVYNGLWRGGKDGKRRNFVEACERIVAMEYRHLAELPGEATDWENMEVDVTLEEQFELQNALSR